MQRSVLIVEDEANMRLVMQMALEQAGFKVLSAESADDAVGMLGDSELDVILTDLRMPGMSGHEFIRICQQQCQDVPVIVVTAYGSIRSAIECIQAGASNYLTKPFEPEALQFAVENALRYRDLLRENQQLHAVLQELLRPPRLVGDSPAMQQLRDQVRRLSAQSSPVLISGERGAGKLALAHALHASGPRAHRPFIVFDCMTNSPDRIEAALFGDIRAEYATDKPRRVGKIAQAHGGSLYLHGINALAPDLLRRIYQVMQEGMFIPLGGNTTQRVDVRFIAGSHNELADESEVGAFDSEPFPAAATLSVPPLRERQEDIPLLAQAFVTELALQDGIADSGISPAALAELMQYHWPGNLRELRHCIEHALLEGGGETIEPAHLPARILAQEQEATVELDALSQHGLDTWLDNAERSMIVQALDACDGVQVNAARMLGINERSLWHRMKKLNIQVNKKVSK